MKSFFELVHYYALDIKNNRTLNDITNHMDSEIVELKEELKKKEIGEVAGADGITGESIDVILCALDLLIINNPRVTEQEFLAIAEAKLAKWKRRYGQSIDGDRSIE